METPKKSRSKSRYNPRKFARKVRGTETLPGNVQGYITKSWTRDDGTEHEGHIDAQTGDVRCGCEDFTITRSRMAPDWLRPQTWCKHIETRLARLEATGEIPKLQQRIETDRAVRQARVREMMASGEFDDIIDC